MDEQTRSFLRSIAAIAFLGVLAVVLALPVIRADPSADRAERTPSPRVADTPAERPSTPSPKETERSETGQEGSIEMAGTWPSECLEPATGPSGPGSIAAASSKRISIGTPSSPTTTFAGRAPVMWSPSGRYLAWGPGSVYDVSKRRRVEVLDRRVEAWTWSPIADCLIGSDGTSLIVAPVGEPPVEFLTGNISSFGVTPEGRFLSAHPDKGSFVGFNLRRGTAVPARRSGPIFEGVAPFGCRDVPEDYVFASCAPNSRFGVAIHNPDHDEGGWGRLWLIGADGDPLRAIATGAYEDTAPEWGPARTGVLFLRRPEGTERFEVWYLPEGGNPGRTPLRVSGLGNIIDHESFRPWWFVDWNATPPSGEPVPTR